MIRTVWVFLVVGLATLFFGLIAIGASLLRVRGGVYAWATRQWSRTILAASATPVVVEGMDEVDWSRPHLLVSNHLSGYDIFAIAGVLPLPYYFVAKKELERIPFFGRAWKAAGHISIDRSDRQKAIQSLRRAGEKMRRERTTVIIFPEGTRSRTGGLQPFKKGAFVLAAQAGVPIVPVVVRGSDQIAPPGTMRVRPRPIELEFCAPIDPAQYGEERVEALMEQVRARMLARLRPESLPPAEPPA